MNTFFLYFYPVQAMIFGLFIGSFLNVLIYRLPLMIVAEYSDDPNAGKVNLWWPPSHCPTCGMPVWRRDNIPIISWLWLKGKCRHCRSVISAQYLISEILCGVVFTFLAVYALPHFTIVQVCCFFLYFCLLYSLAVIDFKHLLLPDSLVSMLLWSGLLCSVSGITHVEPQDAVFGAAAAWVVTWSVMTAYEKIRGKEGLGYGDVKLFAAISAWLGINQLSQLIIFSSLSGVFIYLVYTFLNKRRSIDENNPDALKHYIPFGPSIALGGLVIFFTGLL